MGATEGFMKAQIEQLKEENRKLKKDLEFVYGWKDQLEKENKKLKEDREKINSAIGDLVRENRKLKEEVEKLKSTYVYDAKQVRDIC